MASSAASFVNAGRQEENVEIATTSFGSSSLRVIDSSVTTPQQSVKNDMFFPIRGSDRSLKQTSCFACHDHEISSLPKDEVWSEKSNILEPIEDLESSFDSTNESKLVAESKKETLQDFNDDVEVQINKSKVSWPWKESDQNCQLSNLSENYQTCLDALKLNPHKKLAIFMSFQYGAPSIQDQMKRQFIEMVSNKFEVGSRILPIIPPSKATTKVKFKVRLVWITWSLPLVFKSFTIPLKPQRDKDLDFPNEKFHARRQKTLMQFTLAMMLYCSIARIKEQSEK